MIESQWIGNSKLKTFYYNDFFKRKRVIEEVEGNFTRAPIDATNPEVTEVDIESNADEYITAGDKVRKIYKYIDEMEIDLE